MGEFVISGFSDEISEDTTKQFEHLKNLGIEYFEPRGIDGKNISLLSESEAKALRTKMDSYGIKVSSIGSPIGKININDDFDRHLELLSRVIKTAKLLDTKYIRVFSFYVGGEYEKSRDEVIFRMKKMTELAAKAGVILLHENEKGIYGDIADRCLDILKSVDSDNLRAVFDPANFVQCGQKTYPDAYELLLPYIRYVHIKDALENGNVVPAGYGVGHVSEILSSLKKSGYCGFLSLEPHLGSFTGIAELESGTEIQDKERSTPEKFTLAYESLKKLL